MSRTFKDTPAARKGRKARQADLEIPFEYSPSAYRVPADAPWDAFADATLDQDARLSAAAYLRLTAAPCPHSCSQADDRQPQS